MLRPKTVYMDRDNGTRKAKNREMSLSMNWFTVM